MGEYMGPAAATNALTSMVSRPCTLTATSLSTLSCDNQNAHVLHASFKSLTAFPTASPTPYPPAFPTPAPTGILAHATCPHTTCTYTVTNGVARTLVQFSKRYNEKWHCERFGNGCRCVCHNTLSCAIRHHHETGYKKALLSHC